MPGHQQCRRGRGGPEDRGPRSPPTGRPSGPGLCRGCSSRPQRSIAIWTVLEGPTSVGWASDLRWREQPHPENGYPPANIPEPFRIRTLDDATPRSRLRNTQRRSCASTAHSMGCRRYPEPPTSVASCTEKGQTPIGSFASTGLGERDLERAIALIQRRRPDLLRQRAPPLDVGGESVGGQIYMAARSPIYRGHHSAAKWRQAAGRARLVPLA
ncbi:hypothetical protein HPB47_018287 [Ixodes persulcatus]|uniref:Uncharacterized protein n=1 Tax=Ixodes persulcatus TaxID=34615 RepID=A0AC60QL47_IXOPE|nr:hypothetical protein HPB47_018287 [Ixodes persulcatus]